MSEPCERDKALVPECTEAFLTLDPDRNAAS